MTGVRKAFDPLPDRTRYAKIKGRVPCDARRSPSRLLDQAVEITNAFVDSGEDRIDHAGAQRRPGTAAYSATREA